MPRSLPFELQLLILGHLYEARTNYYTVLDGLTPLRSCSLVCRAWFPICRGYLMKAVHIRSRSQLEDVLSALRSNRAGALGFHSTTKLLLGQTHCIYKPFHHLAIHYLPPKLPRTKDLWFQLPVRIYQEKKQKPSSEVHETATFPIPSSFPVMMRQFRALTHLVFWECRFESLWDFRRIVVALPVLSDLTLRSITWPPPFETHHVSPIFFHTASQLVNVTINDCPRPWDIIWLWTTTVTASSLAALASQSRSHNNQSTIRHCPAFTARESPLLGRVLEQLSFTDEIPKAQWSHDRVSNTWKFTYGHQVEHSVGKMVELQISATEAMSRSTTKSKPRWIGCIQSISYIDEIPPSPELAKEVDLLSSQLPELKNVNFVFRPRFDTILSRDLRKAYARNIIDVMPLARQGNQQFSLNFTFGERTQTWEELRQGTLSGYDVGAKIWSEFLSPDGPLPAGAMAPIAFLPADPSKPFARFKNR